MFFIIKPTIAPHFPLTFSNGDKTFIVNDMYALETAINNVLGTEERRKMIEQLLEMERTAALKEKKNLDLIPV